MTLSDFGLRIWGRGEAEAKERLATITRAELIDLKLDEQKIGLLLSFYLSQVSKGKGLPTSQARVELMQKCLAVLNE